MVESTRQQKNKIVAEPPNESWFGPTAQPQILTTEERIVNLAEIKTLELHSFAFCVICQELIMPKEANPVYCSGCQTAVYCQCCIVKWR